jgi:tight adherence protein C
MVTALLAFLAAATGSAGLALLISAEGRRWTEPEEAARLVTAGRRMEPGGAAEPVTPGRREESGGAVVFRMLAAAGRFLRSPGAPPDLRARIRAAGRPAGLGVREIMAAKVAAALLAGLAAMPLAAVAPGRLGLVLTPLVPVAAFLAPDVWLARLAAERARRVRRDLPALLDILRVTIEAGGSLAWALRAVGERADGPLASEWRAVAAEVSLGVALDDALEGLAARLPQPEIRSFVAALRRAARHGAPLSDTLAGQARAARFALARRIREDAARAGPKIQLVVALLLVPSVLLLVAAALASALLVGSADAVPL